MSVICLFYDFQKSNTSQGPPVEEGAPPAVPGKKASSIPGYSRSKFDRIPKTRAGGVWVRFSDEL